MQGIHLLPFIIGSTNRKGPNARKNPTHSGCNAPFSSPALRHAGYFHNLIFKVKGHMGPDSTDRFPRSLSFTIVWTMESPSRSVRTFSTS